MKIKFTRVYQNLQTKCPFKKDSIKYFKITLFVGLILISLHLIYKNCLRKNATDIKKTLPNTRSFFILIIKVI